MAEQNSAAVNQTRPDDLRTELGIKKDAYYEDIKFLGIKAHRDGGGKAYLDDEQVTLIKALRSHVEAMGKRDGFAALSEADPIPQGELATTQPAAMGSAMEFPEPQPVDPYAGMNIEALIREAAELKGQQLAMPDLVRLELANRMTYDDLPEDVQAKVRDVQEAACPKHQPAHLADQLLSQWRSQRVVA